MPQCRNLQLGMAAAAAVETISTSWKLCQGLLDLLLCSACPAGNLRNSQDGAKLNITTRSSADEVVATLEVTLMRLVPQFIDFTAVAGSDTAALIVKFTLKDGVSACTESDRLVILDNVDLE